MLALANYGSPERIEMSRRFEYARVTAEEFSEALSDIGMPPLAFGRIFGFEEKRIRQWMSGEQDIPIWVPVVMAVLQNVPGAIPEARQAAAEIIVRDNFRPQDGEFPYLAKGEVDAD